MSASSIIGPTLGYLSQGFSMNFHPVGKPGPAPGRHQPGPPHGGHPGPKHTVPGP